MYNSVFATLNEILRDGCRFKGTFINTVHYEEQQLYYNHVKTRNSFQMSLFIYYSE